uniref:LEM domain-containing protein n=1 Tax=Panagrellus redivivus TaxID=6233 RepID=A0A7E4UXX6_PANRE
MPPSSHSRRNRSIRDDDTTSKSYADEASTESGEFKSVKEDNIDVYQRLRKLVTVRNLFLYCCGLVFVITLFLIATYMVIAVYLSQNIENVDFTEACEDIFGESEDHIEAQKTQ